MDLTDAKSTAVPAEPGARIAFLECWIEQLESERDAARAAAEGARAEARHQARRAEASLAARAEAERARSQAEQALRSRQAQADELELARHQADARQGEERTRLQAALREAEREVRARVEELALQAARLQDARARLNALEAAHDRLFQRLLELHARAARGEPAELDLASFIAELRAEVQGLQALLARAAARESGDPPRPHPDEPSRAEPPPGPAEGMRALIARLAAAEDGPLATHLAHKLLQAGPRAERTRAAEGLLALLGAGAAPLVATAAARAPEELRAGLLGALGAAGQPALWPMITGFLGDPGPSVRAAALDGAARLLDAQPEAVRQTWPGLLSRCLADLDAGVRRRALVHASGLRGVDPGSLAAGLLDDPDAGVRRVACAALAGTRQPLAQSALLGALLDEDGSVRAAAQRAAELLFGPPVADLLARPEAERRATVEALRGTLEVRGRLGQEARAGESAHPATEVRLDEVQRLLRGALSGLSPEALGLELERPAESLQEPLESWVRAGQVVRRGGKLFPP
jgi:hypothetical protein